MATWIVLRDLLTAREIFVINIHYDNVSQPSRESSSSLIRTQLDTLASGRPTILTGDLNQSEENAALRILLDEAPTLEPQLIDGYRQVFLVRQTDEATFHEFDGYTAGSRIDFILHDARFVIVAADIRTDTIDDRFPSDRYPVTGTLAYSEGVDGASCF